MTEPGQGLRFDVYERVQLPVDAEDIRALEEIELTPHIGVFRENGQVVLRGHLLLAGLYEAEAAEGGSRTLEHWIPVEISLPSSRVSETGGISVAIDNFDVDLIAPRTLNITGVLSLQGVAVRQEDAPEPWAEEAFAFSHEPSADGGESETGWDLQPPGPLYPQQQPAWTGQSSPWNGPAVTEPQADAPRSSEGAPQAPGTDEGTVRDERPPYTPIAVQWQETGSEAGGAGGVQPASGASSGGREQEAAAQPKAAPGADAIAEATFGEALEPEHGASAGQAQAFQAELVPEPEPEPPTQAGLKIGFAAQKSQSDGIAEGLKPLLAKTRDGEREPAAGADPVQEDPAAGQQQQQAGADDIRWRNLFLRSREEERDFRKVRMCIVQREETLDAIAGRYRLNPRELQLYNRLDDEAVREGQVLYIP